MMRAIILASASINRRQILERAGVPFTVMVSDADESAEGLAPQALVVELARRKADAVRQRCCFDDIVVSADTVVSIGDRILGKPRDAAEARDFLHLLSGHTHVVFTGVCITAQDKRRLFAVQTEVCFYPLTEDEIEAYIESGEPFGKAGAYGIQGAAALFVKEIHGDYNNAVGLPLARVMREISDMQIK